MKRRALLLLFAFVLVSSLAGRAQDNGYWRASSSNAIAITGDITLSDTKVALNFAAFPMVKARALQSAEVSAAFDAEVNGGATGLLYHVTVPAGRRLSHHNTLCGAEDTQWMATFASGRTLQVAFFSGVTAPTLTVDALAQSTDLCGAFSYTR